MYIAILAGGVGSRLWPRSRQSHPKQFSDITGSGRTMIQETVDRLAGVASSEQIYIITGQQYVDLAAEQLPEIPRSNIIGEPYGRNTGPAIALGCAHIYSKDPNGIVGFLHADQTIPQVDKFQEALKRAAKAAEDGYLTTLGVSPTFPHPGFGYIKRSDEVQETANNTLPIYQVEQFLEKPDLATATAFLQEGGYYWNGGMFICRIDRMREEFSRQQPDISSCMKRIVSFISEDGAEADFESIWADMPNISIDHGIMESAKQVAVVPLDAGWNDVGSWDALEEIRPHDSSENCVASGELLAIDSQHNIVYSDKLVALIGLEDIVVVDTGDALLVGKKAQMQKVKNVVETLKSQNRLDLI